MTKINMTEEQFDEIVQEVLYLEADDDDKCDLINLLFSLSEELDCEDSYEKIYEYRVKNGECPSCRSDIEVDTYSEDRGEYFGFPAREQMNVLYCPYCGWQDER